MPLLLTADVVRSLMGVQEAMQALVPLMIEEAEGTTFHMPPYGGRRQRTFRVVGGGMSGIGRMGLRSAEAVLLFSRQTRDLLAIVGGDLATLRIGATLSLAASYLARPDARSIGLLGSGRTALPLLECMRTVRPIERVRVYSPTAEHRTAFAERASKRLELEVTAHDTAQEALAEADIVLTATNARRPALSYADLHPGVHVSSMGAPTELDESVWLGADQLVAPNREEELDRAYPGVAPYVPGALWRLVHERRLALASIVELGSIIKGDVAPRNGPRDINVFRDARGGVGEVALAAWVYERARERGLGQEIEL